MRSLDAALGELADARSASRTVTALHIASATTLAASLSSSLARWAKAHALGRTILVVDDDAAAGATLAHALRHVAPVVLVGTVDAAAHAMARDRPAVVVADHHLDDPRGRTGASLLASAPRGPRAVLLSGIADEHALAEAARAVNATPVARPVTLPQLDALVDLVRGLFNDATGT